MTPTLASLVALDVVPGAPRLPADAIDAALVALPGWAVANGALSKSYRHADWRATMAFVNAVADMADVVDHHPDLVVAWGRSTIAWSTHDAGGITRNDLACAARTEELAERAGAARAPV
ncbi:4a-hydroxytetrahydrobiopterin dehydratase [Burkholderiales bacterium]|nr:4a-hydroxytetrahydrobiopterin dehydratase [Burkholderiales bacterium]